MAPYDSDSDDDEVSNQTYTETNVLLGYASPPDTSTPDDSTDTITHLGGRPQWLDSDRPPTAALARCKVCKDMLVLLLQLNGELPETLPGHERRLWIWSCRRKSCRRRDGSIRALRSTKVAEGAGKGTATKVESQTSAERSTTTTMSKQEEGPGLGLGNSLFGIKTSATGSASGLNPFSTAKPGSSLVNPFAAAPSPPPTAQAAVSLSQDAPVETPKSTEASLAALPKTFAETLSLNNTQASHGPPPPPEPWPIEAALPPPYRLSYLFDAEYETLAPVSLPSAPKSGASSSKMDVDEGMTNGKDDKDLFESSMDSTFQKFADRVGQNSEQCIRYEFNGVPLLYSRDDDVGLRLHVDNAANGASKVSAAKGMPRCPNCGAGRVFEVQLMPHAIEELEGDESGIEGMDWGTIIVGVCERDCQERGSEIETVGYIEEWAGVQWEELTARR